MESGTFFYLLHEKRIHAPDYSIRFSLCYIVSTCWRKQYRFLDFFLCKIFFGMVSMKSLYKLKCRFFALHSFVRPTYHPLGNWIDNDCFFVGSQFAVAIDGPSPQFSNSHDWEIPECFRWSKGSPNKRADGIKRAHYSKIGKKNRSKNQLLQNKYSWRCPLTEHDNEQYDEPLAVNDTLTWR